MAVYFHRSLLFLMAVALVILAFWVSQDSFGLILICYGVAFGAYLVAGIYSPSPFAGHAKINLLLKLLLVCAFPLGSDDIYRFYWDSQCVLEHISPYRYLPQELLSYFDYDWTIIFTKLNSPHYYSVYPPILQSIFAFCALIGFKSIHLFSISWKLILLIADLGTLHLLQKWLTGEKQKMVWWYAWNPLILYEVLANGHPEGLMLFFIVAAFYLMQQSKYTMSAIMLALAAAVKLFPIILLPFICKHLGLRKGLTYALICMGTFVICMAAIYPYQDHFMASINLYMATFEFNGSLFQLWKALDYQRFGFDNIGHIGKYLAVISMIWFVILLKFQKWKDWDSLLYSIVWMWMGYLLFSTTVHPWYILPLILFGTLTGWLLPFVWSGLIILSYSWYDTRMSEGWKYGLIIIEYLGLLVYFIGSRFAFVKSNI